MYARAAIIGRMTRERNARLSKVIIQPPARFTRKSTVIRPVLPPPMSTKCYLPSQRGPWFTLALALFLIAVGATMCNFAFHAKRYATVGTSTETNTTASVNEALYSGLNSLTYIGPTFMGVGAFLIIVCCVLLFEIKEKRMKELSKSNVEQQQSMSREYTNKAILTKNGADIKQKGSFLAHATEVIANGCGEVMYQSPTNQCKMSNSMSSSISNVYQQFNSISTICPATIPTIALDPPICDDFKGDRWMSLVRLSTIHDCNGPIRELQRDGVNPAYEYSDYDLKSVKTQPETKDPTSSSETELENVERDNLQQETYL